MKPETALETLLNYGMAGGLLVVMYLLGRLLVMRVGIPVAKKHMEALTTWQEETKSLSNSSAVMADAIASIQKTQVEIHAAVATFGSTLSDHVRQRQEYDAKILTALDCLIVKIKGPTEEH